MRGWGRALMAAGALLLLATAALHAAGCQMVAGWTEAMAHQQSQALQLVWLTDSLTWGISAIVWLIAAYRPDRSWRGAAILLAIVPLLTGAAIMFIEPKFFGGYLLIVSAGLVVAGSGMALRWTEEQQPNAGAP